MNDAAERELMTRIQKQYGPLLVSTQTASGVPAAFFAALIANETGGKPDATRFEPGVFTALAEVLLGRKAHYGSLGAQDLAPWVDPAAGQAGIQAAVAVTVLKKLADLATSWGLTQIMGYEAVAFHLIDGVAALASPVTSMARTTIMLKEFARRNNLDVSKNFPELFDCWNTGRPHAPTADPTYIPDGLARMALYHSLESDV